MNDILDVHALRSLREAKGWDQLTLARTAGIDKSVISRLERGTQVDLRASVLIGLARALQTPVDSLLATPFPYEPANAAPELVRVVADAATLRQETQRHIAAIIRTYIAELPSSESKTP